MILQGATLSEQDGMRAEMRELRAEIENQRLLYWHEHEKFEQTMAENEQLRTALRNVRAYIQDCDHDPAIDEIDAVLHIVDYKKSTNKE